MCEKSEMKIIGKIVNGTILDLSDGIYIRDDKGRREINERKILEFES